MDTKRLFDEIAPTYDRLNRLLSLGLDSGWRRQAVRALAPHKPKLILDVATGSGDLAIAALALGPGCRHGGGYLPGDALPRGNEDRRDSGWRPDHPVDRRRRGAAVRRWLL